MSFAASPAPSASTSTIVAAAEHLAAQLGTRAEQHDVALAEQRDAVADALHAIEQMRRQQHRDVALLELADDLQQLDRRLRIEAGGRLVEDRDLRVLHQDFGKAEPLPHAARERRDPLVGDVVQPDVVERVARSSSSRSSRSRPIRRPV